MMRIAKPILRPIALVLFIMVNPCIAAAEQYHLKSFDDVMIKSEYTYSEVTSLSALHCGYKCSRNESCLSASYGENEESCRLSSYHVKDQNYQMTSFGSSWTTFFKGCPLGWTEIGVACYNFIRIDKNFTDAKITCAEKYGKLAEPQTDRSFEMLRNHMLNNFPIRDSSSFWIGLVDITEQGDFVWTSNGVAPSYEAWDREQYLGDYCVFLLEPVGYLWRSDLCSAKFNFICEI